MYGVRVTQIVKGRVEMELFADQAWHSRDVDWIHGRGVHAFYYPETQKTATLYADTVRYEVHSRRLEALGAVRVESDGTIIETEELQYDSMKQKIVSEEFVTILRGPNVMTGVGLIADPDLGNLSLMDPHISVKNPEEIRPLIKSLDGP